MSSTDNKIDEIKKGEIIFRGIPFHSIKKEIIVKILDDNIKTDRVNNHISITNTESMYYANKYPEHRDYIIRATFSFCDGVGIVHAARFKNKFIKRYHGSDFMDDVCRYGQTLGWRHFFLGGKPEVIETLSNNLLTKYPRMILAGTYSPPYRELNTVEEDHIIRVINQSNADMLWVGLGLLKQERWIDKHKNRLNVPWNVGVGAAFDFHSGNKARAPIWIRNIGFEWLYRLIREPRMFKRNINSMIFLLNTLIHKSNLE